MSLEIRQAVETRGRDYRREPWEKRVQPSSEPNEYQGLPSFQEHSVCPCSGKAFKGIEPRRLFFMYIISLICTQSVLGEDTVRNLLGIVKMESND